METGQATIVIDALDELFERNALLYAIPEELARCSRGLVSGRGPVITEFHSRRRGVNEIHLDNLSREDIPLVLGIESEQPKEKEFIEEVFRRTRGLALAVRNTAENIKKNKGLLSIDLIEAESELWEKHLRDWENHEDPEKANALEAMLPLFLFFECAGLGLKNDELQAFLREQGIGKKLRWLQDALVSVDTQLVGVHSGNAKLQNHGFADHCLKNAFSRHDLEYEFGKVLGWISKSLKSISPETIAVFSAYWYDSSDYLDQSESPLLFEPIIEALCQNEEISKEVVEELQAVDAESSFIHDFLEVGCKNKISFCQFELGKKLINEKKSYKRGVELLEAAISQGNLAAKSSLGFAYLLNKIGSQEDSEVVGKKFLVDAFFEGDRSFKFLMDDMLFDDFWGGEPDPKNGQRVLEKLIEEGDVPSMMNLGTRLLDGRGLDQNVYKGEEFLRLACKKNSSAAMRVLGFRYLDGKGLDKNIEEGLSLLERSIEKGDARTLFTLGVRKLKGTGIVQDTDGAKELLIQACDADFPPAMLFLGVELINGENLDQDRAKGIDLLNKAIKLEHTPSKRTLGALLLKGEMLSQNLKKGEELLHSAIDDGDVRAEVILGCHYIDGKTLDCNPVQGVSLLEKAIKKGNKSAYEALGERLIQGKNIEKDELRGRLLIQLFESGQTTTSIIDDGFKSYSSEKKEAAESFLNAFKANCCEQSGNNLAYMMHRGEVPESVKCPEVETLLNAGIKVEYTFSYINYALCLAKGFGFKKDWRKADNEFCKLIDFGRDQDYSWWTDLSEKNDADGHLVVGWLTRYGLIEDPESLSIKVRMNCAKECGFDVPDWMNERAIIAL